MHEIQVPQYIDEHCNGCHCYRELGCAAGGWGKCTLFQFSKMETHSCKAQTNLNVISRLCDVTATVYLHQVKSLYCEEHFEHPEQLFWYKK